jgi:hypothetical protein
MAEKYIFKICCIDPDKAAAEPFRGPGGLSLIFVSILSELFLAFMGCNFSKFALSSAGHFSDSFT